MALTDVQALDLTEKLYRRLSVRRQDTAVFEAYYRGEQPLRYATAEWSTAHADRYRDFSDNWCGVVGSAPGERRAVDGFRVGDDGDVQDPDEKDLWRAWEVNDGPAQASQGFLASTISKRSAVIVWADEDGEPELTWESPAQVIVDFDPARPREGRYALKAWLDDDLELATLYTRDGIWKYQRPAISGSVMTTLTGERTQSGLYVVGNTGGWQPRYVDNEQWPLANDLGVLPVVEFANRPMLGSAPLSDIAGAVAMQDAINLLWAYLFTAADFASMPARVVMGQAPPQVPILDANGQEIGKKPIDIEALTKGRMLWLTGQATSVGSWDAAKLDVFTDVINVAVKHVASQTRTPIHYIVGDLGNVNGETLTATETPLAMKVHEGNLYYTPSVRAVFRRIALVQGKKDLAEACRMGTVMWRDPETRSQAQLADALLKWSSIGFPFEWLAEKAGLTQTDLARVMEMKKTEDAAALEALIPKPVPGQPEPPPPAPDQAPPAA